MFAAPLPVMICLFFIYSPPELLGDSGLFLWLTVLTVLMRTSITLFHVPHLALGAELSADFTERTRVMSLNTLLGGLGGYGTYIIALTFFFNKTPEFDNGLLNAAAYPGLAISAALLGGTVMLASTVLTLKVVPLLPPMPDSVERFSLSSFLLDLKSALTNRNYLMLLIGYLLLSATLGTRDTIGLHMNTYYWELVPSQIRYFALAGLAATLFGYAVTAPLHNRLAKFDTSRWRVWRPRCLATR